MSKNKMYKITYRKLLSLILAGTLAVSGVYALPLRCGVNAAYYQDLTQYKIVHLQPQGSDNHFVISEDGENVTFKYKDSSGVEQTASVPNGEYKIEIWAGATSEINGNVNLKDVVFYSDSGIKDLTINSGSTLTVPVFGFNGCDGKIIVNGTFILDNLDYEVMYDQRELILENAGTIIAKEMNLTSDIGTSDSPVYKVSDSFKKNDFDLKGVVEVERETTIESAGGTFTLKMGGITKTITEAVPAGTKASSLLLDSSAVSLGDIPSEIYYGKDYDFSNKISYASGYTGTPYLVYSNSVSGTFSEDKPTSVGYHYVKAIAPEDESFAESSSEIKGYQIKYLSLSDVGRYDDGSLVKLSGLYEGYIVKDSFTIAPASTWKIKDDKPNHTDYESSLTINRSDIYIDGNIGYNSSLLFGFERNDSAKTGINIGIRSVIGNIDNLAFDDYAPGISNVLIDGREASIENGDTIVGDSLSLSISDDVLLDKVVVTEGETSTIYTPEVDPEEGSVYPVDLTFDSVWGETKDITITSTDKVGRSSTISFALKHPLVTPNASVSVTGAIVGSNYEPVLTTDSDGKADAEYFYKEKDADTTAYSSEKPVSAGTYNVKAVIPETAKYTEASCEGTFTIEKRTPSVAEVTVADYLAGGTAEPVITTDSDGKDRATFEYKSSNTPDNSFSTVIPSVGGEYTVRATIPETDTYKSAVCSGTFKVNRYTVGETKVEITDTYFGVDYDPVLTTDSDGKSQAVFEYKVQGAEDSTYTETKPETAGKYTVRATIPETDKYEQAICTSDFMIKKYPVGSATVDIQDTYVGVEYDPVLNTDSDGKSLAEFTYKAEGADDTTYISSKPLLAGTYIVRVRIPETDKYEGASCYKTFTIKKMVPLSSSVNVEDINVGGAVSPVINTESDGKDSSIIEYKIEGADDNTYTTVVPSKAGKYNVRVTIPETDKYESASCYNSFTINKLVPTTARVTVEDIKVGGAVSPVIDTDSDGKASSIIEYKADGAEDSSYTTVVPSKVGKYTIRVTIPETETYQSISCQTTFTISRKVAAKASLEISDGLVGTELSPVFETDSDGKSSVVIEYKNKDANDNSYTTTQPTKQGTYVARATVPETDTYESISCTTEFSMNYLDAPEVAYTLSGTEGKNDFYTSDVVVKAPDGFSICRSLGGTYTSSLNYEVGLKTLYLRRNSDGALTDGIAFDKEVKIDKLSPTVSVMTDQDGNAVVGENKIYADTLNVKVKDENLASVLVDGDNVELDGQIGTAFLDCENGEKTFNIEAEDLAGNTLTTSVTITATWLMDKVIPANKLLPLTPGQYYKLEAGRWTVDGDSTVYNGDCEVCVNKMGNYTFNNQ